MGSPVYWNAPTYHIALVSVHGPPNIKRMGSLECGFPPFSVFCFNCIKFFIGLHEPNQMKSQHNTTLWISNDRQVHMGYLEPLFPHLSPTDSSFLRPSYSHDRSHVSTTILHGTVPEILRIHERMCIAPVDSHCPETSCPAHIYGAEVFNFLAKSSIEYVLQLWID